MKNTLQSFGIHRKMKRKRNSYFRIAAVLQSTVTICRLQMKTEGREAYLPIAISGIIKLKGKTREHCKK